MPAVTWVAQLLQRQPAVVDAMRAREITPNYETTSFHEWIASGTNDITQQNNSISNKGSSRILRHVECWCGSPKQLLVAYGTRERAATR